MPEQEFSRPACQWLYEIVHGWICVPLSRMSNCVSCLLLPHSHPDEMKITACLLVTGELTPYPIKRWPIFPPVGAQKGCLCCKCLCDCMCLCMFSQMGELHDSSHPVWLCWCEKWCCVAPTCIHVASCPARCQHTYTHIQKHTQCPTTETVPLTPSVIFPSVPSSKYRHLLFPVFTSLLTGSFSFLLQFSGWWGWGQSEYQSLSVIVL